jgi:hypothetical protein
MLKMKEFDVMEGWGGGAFLVRLSSPWDLVTKHISSLSSSWDLVTNTFVTNSLFDET